MRLDLLLPPLMALVFAGCGTQRFTLTASPLPIPAERREGTLSLRVMDKRDSTERIGTFLGVMWSKNDIVLNEDAKLSLTRFLTEGLRQCGYTVVLDASPTVEAEIREFQVVGDTFTQSSRLRLRTRLRDKAGGILWEKDLSGEDGGWSAGGAPTYQKRTNNALDRLLRNAVDEFSSEFFYQNLKNAR